MWLGGTPTWIQSILTYLKDQALPDDKKEAYKLKRRPVHFIFLDDILYKRYFSPLPSIC